MHLDRAFQLHALKEFASIYPHWKTGRWSELDSDEWRVKANLFYLQELGLVELRAALSLEEQFVYQGGKITAKGMDFLEDDGGLSAMLGVVTVRLHDDTIKSLIEARIHASDLPEPEKKRYLDRLRELPVETTKHLVLKLVDLGLEQGSGAMALIGKLFGCL